MSFDKIIVSYYPINSFVYTTLIRIRCSIYYLKLSNTVSKALIDSGLDNVSGFRSSTLMKIYPKTI